jgi:hypothetical protein
MKAANDLVRFCLELAALASLAAFAWHASNGLIRWAAVLAAPLAAAAFWGWLIAPQSAHRLGDPTRFLVELAFFACAFVALALSGRPRLAIALALLAVINTPLDRVLATT